jgi:hypothetical protein
LSASREANASNRLLPFTLNPVAVGAIPHFLSFSTPRQARQLCFVEAKLGLSFL